MTTWAIICVGIFIIAELSTISGLLREVIKQLKEQEK